MSEVTVAALQLAFSDDVQENIAAVSELVREAAGKGAKLILPPELFEGHYFCRTQDEGHFTRAHSGYHWSQHTPTPMRAPQTSHTLNPSLPGRK